jgi:hypothetical protein
MLETSIPREIVMTYKTVFDASQHGYENLWSLAPVLIFVAIGAMLVFRPALMQLILPRGLQGRARMILSWVFFIFSLLFATVGFLSVILEQLDVTADLAEGRYSVVEGPVANFVPMPYEGHADESFTVNSASHGGPIREGLDVRISFVRVSYGNLILRLEVAQ